MSTGYVIVGPKLTRLDYFAAAALQGLLAKHERPPFEAAPSAHVRTAWDLAEKMVQERSSRARSVSTSQPNGELEALREFVLAWDQEIGKAGIWGIDCSCRRVFERMAEARTKLRETTP